MEPLISVITPTLNAGPKLAATVASVLSQRPASYEYLIIDGGSTDGTQEQLQSLGGAVSWTSEPDTGIYDAMNKGLRPAAGRFVYFLGAGNRLLPGVFEAVASELAKSPPKADRPCLLYGDVTWARFPKPYDGRFTTYKLLRANICHQAIFYQQSLFEQLGDYDLKYRMFADWDFNLRCFAHRGVEKRYVPLLVAEFESGGESGKSLDPVFYADLPWLIHQRLGLCYALMMHAHLLYNHPQSLLGEPLRMWRRLLAARTSRRQVARRSDVN